MIHVENGRAEAHGITLEVVNKFGFLAKVIVDQLKKNGVTDARDRIVNVMNSYLDGKNEDYDDERME